MLRPDELYAFAVTNLPPIDLLALELGGSHVGRILFWRQDPANGWQLFSATPEGLNVQQIPLALGQLRPAPSFVRSSPDGRQIALYTTDSAYIANADGTNALRFNVGGGLFATGLSWSTSGTTVVFAGAVDRTASSIYSSSPSGGSPTRLTSAAGKVDLMPTWSPDGSRVAFARNRDDQGGYEIWTMRADGTGQRRLTTTTGVDYDLYPQWSPDGSTIVFERARLTHPDVLVQLPVDSREVWIMNADGTNARVLASGPGDAFPAWSPDGKQILYERIVTGEGIFLAVMNADGSGSVQLPIANGATQATWLP